MQPVKVAMVQQLYSMNTYLADVRIRVEMVNPSTSGRLSEDVDGVDVMNWWPKSGKETCNSLSFIHVNQTPLNIQAAYYCM